MAKTDLPPGVINIVHGRGAGAGKALCTSPKIGMISFTGSVETGSAIMAAAAPNITKLESGIDHTPCSGYIPDFKFIYMAPYFYYLANNFMTWYHRKDARSEEHTSELQSLRHLV